MLTTGNMLWRKILPGLVALLLGGLAIGCASSEGAKGADEPSLSEPSASSEAESPAASAPPAASSDAADPLPAVPDEAYLDLASVEEAVSQGADDVVLVDVRTFGVYANMGTIPGAKNIPDGRQMEIRLEEFPRDKTIVLLTQDGTGAERAYALLLDQGYDSARIRVARGGVDAWVAAGHDVELSQTPHC